MNPEPTLYKNGDLVYVNTTGLPNVTQRIYTGKVRSSYGATSLAGHNYSHQMYVVEPITAYVDMAAQLRNGPDPLYHERETHLAPLQAQHVANILAQP